MNTIQAQSLPIIARQTITAPHFAKFLDVNLDMRHNNCLLWTLADPAKDAKTEKVELVMVKLGEPLDPPNAKYVGGFRANSGYWHVFALRESENILHKALPT